MSNVIAVYVGKAGMTNLRVGLEAGTWGFKTPQPDYDRIEPGDVLLLGYGFAGGSPRVQLQSWLEHDLEAVEVGVVTSGIQQNAEPLWPDEGSLDVSYPHRFGFEYRGRVEGVRLGADGPLGQEVADALRRSAISQGRAYVLDGPAGFTLEVSDSVGLPPLPTERPGTTDSAAPLDAVLASFERELMRAGLQLPGDLPMRFLCGLMAKPFVILTGLSGSGKTQLALALGRWIGRERTFVSAVRPDWTGSEALFGYENLLLPPSSDGRAAWSVPEELRFMLEAADNPDEPYLLLLDEMNLAHVERYFADVLSGMESAWGVLPNLGRDEDGIWRVSPDGPNRLPFPANLLLVGTVNTDETTYQFSPKVLDRSTSLEFRVATEHLAAGRPDLSLIQPASAESRRMLLDPPTDVDGLLDAELLKNVEDLHRLLARHGREFGHRTYQEMLRFAALMKRAQPACSDDAVLDYLVAQKVLPRIHGSSRELSGLMGELMVFVGAKQQAEVDSRPLLTVSGEKLTRMQTELEATHFTAF